MRILPFARFQNLHEGDPAVVVGRGLTSYDYSQLCHERGVVFFINDAVCMEKHLKVQVSYFFFHDAAMKKWLRLNLKSIAVIPEDGKCIGGLTDPALIESGCSGVLYRWNGMSGGELLKLGPAKVAELRQLYRHTGTIHSLLHFVWFCGIRKIKFIGCNGCNDKQRAGSSGAGDDGYDERLVNLSGTKPWWQYSEIRQKQDELCRMLGIHFEHVPMP